MDAVARNERFFFRFVIIYVFCTRGERQISRARDYIYIPLWWSGTRTHIFYVMYDDDVCRHVFRFGADIYVERRRRARAFIVLAFNNMMHAARIARSNNAPRRACACFILICIVICCGVYTAQSLKTEGMYFFLHATPKGFCTLGVFIFAYIVQDDSEVHFDYNDGEISGRCDFNIGFFLIINLLIINLAIKALKRRVCSHSDS